MKRLSKSEQRLVRIEKILLTLDKLGYASRRQIQIIHDLGSDRNAQRFLTDMENSDFIKSIRQEMKIYFLSKKGRDMIGSTKEVNTGQIEHNLMRNDLYIHLNSPASWRNEKPTSFNVKKPQEGRKVQYEVVQIIPDATYETEDGRHVFVEIDHTQSLKNNKEKIKKYGELNRKLNDKQKNMKLIFYTVSSIRKKILLQEGEKEGLEIEVLTKEDIMI